MRLLIGRTMYLERAHIAIVLRERFTLQKPWVIFSISTITDMSGAHGDDRETLKEIAINIRVTRAEYRLRK